MVRERKKVRKVKKKVGKRKVKRANVIILGAAGRDFHNFNVFFRNRKYYNVVCFTATQIPGISKRSYPRELAGKLYPKGIPIYPEQKLTKLIKKFDVEQVVFAYSDVRHEHVMHLASEANAAGADFKLMGIRNTAIKSKKPVISVCATRTGAGKSQTTRKVAEILRKMGKTVAVIRHPMPYGDLRKQICQKYASYADLDRQKCTLEEREEYEPHIEMGNLLFAGVDYGVILKEAEKSADVIIWDGGNNDLPFYMPDLHIVVADPHRAGDGLDYYPGEANLRMADIVIINKEGTAKKEDIKKVYQSVKKVNPKATIVHADSPVYFEQKVVLRGRRALVVEDGPTLTHGGMSYGAGRIAAKRAGARIVNPKRYAVGSIKKTFEKFSQLGDILPAMGYGKKQLRELRETINRVPADFVVVGTPIDLRKLIKMNKPALRVRYYLKEKGTKLKKAVQKAGRMKK